MKKFNSVSLNYIGGSYVLDVYGEPNNVWFKAVDIAEMLEHTNASKMVKDACDESEKVLTNSYTPGGEQATVFVSENGLYQILLTSRKSFAKQVQKTVFQYLREIRKYGVTGTSERLTELANNPDLLIELANKIKEERARADAEKERADKAENTIEEMKQRDIKTVANELQFYFKPTPIHKRVFRIMREKKVWDGKTVNKDFAPLFSAYKPNENGFFYSLMYNKGTGEYVTKLIKDWLEADIEKEINNKQKLF